MVEINHAYSAFQLDNGLQVVLQKTPTKTISGLLRVHHGAVHEIDGKENGLAHFLEHLLIRGGTKKYAVEEAAWIRETLGDRFAAMTCLDKTVFSSGMLSKHFELYLDFLSDMVFNPRFDGPVINQERQRVFREIADRYSSPKFQSERMFEKALFRNKHHTHDVGGDLNIIKKATQDNFKAFHSRGYHANNMELVLVGGLPLDTEDLVVDCFADKPSGTGKKFAFPDVEPLTKKEILHIHAPDLYFPPQPDMSTAEIIMGMLVPPETSEEYIPLALMAYVLGGHSNSGLFETISQQEGLAYEVNSVYKCSNTNRACVLVEGGIPSRMQEKAIGIVFDEMHKLQKNLVDKWELDLLKDHWKYELALRSETNEGMVYTIETILDIGLDLDAYFSKIDAVTPSIICELANKYLPKSQDDENYVLMIRDPLLSNGRPSNE